LESLALNTLFLFLFIVFPGIIFRRLYFVGEFSKQFNTSSWINNISISLIPGLIIQILTFILYSKVIGEVEKEDIKKFYNSLSQNSLPDVIFDISSLGNILLYLGILFIISGLIAQLLYIIVRGLKLDKKYTIFRFNNHWHYYLKGEAIEFPDFKELFPNSKALLTEADVLVRLGETESRLYKGFLRQHTIDPKTGDLSEIYLTDVRRYKRIKKKHSDDYSTEIKAVPGHIMVIPYKSIINLNLVFITKTSYNWKSFFLRLVYFLVFLFFEIDFLNIFQKANITGHLLGRLAIFGCWLSIISFIYTYSGHFKKKYTENSRSLMQIRIYLGIAILFFIFCIAFFGRYVLTLLDAIKST